MLRWEWWLRRNSSLKIRFIDILIGWVDIIRCKNQVGSRVVWVYWQKGIIEKLAVLLSWIYVSTLARIGRSNILLRSSYALRFKSIVIWVLIDWAPPRHVIPILTLKLVLNSVRMGVLIIPRHVDAYSCFGRLSELISHNYYSLDKDIQESNCNKAISRPMCNCTTTRTPCKLQVFWTVWLEPLRDKTGQHDVNNNPDLRRFSWGPKHYWRTSGVLFDKSCERKQLAGTRDFA